MFKDATVATAVNAQMANVVWLLSASIETSPVLENEAAEKVRYAAAINSLIAQIEATIVQPLREQHPELKNWPVVSYHSKARP